ncbi:glutamate ABC transporter substrate-binding protein [Nocardia mexicana]|uniref:Amino acid ABC transporter substrate-binding protein (PAAT family) n=1 Tax=Nocardia mexicana TaxID=279262 RepID=A0A370H7K8_9NOCA|nr:glutamate ABC transporter substrate-binding protein [Nocardia mexicana]RDI52672.1 amino acid ABC transporter substrate-binding protein (PAAT family) [Nocardia mexicana]
MRRLARLAAALLGVAAVTLTAACDSGAPAIDLSNSGPPVDTTVNFPAGSTMQRLHDAQKITIGTKFDQPLFGLKNPVTGRPEGFDAEMGKLVAARLGIPANRIEWVETVSANREPFLQQGRVDAVIATYTINDKRKEIINFAGPYYIAGQSLMVRHGNPAEIAGPDDLSGKNVCAVEGSASSTNMRNRVPGAHVVLFDSYSKCAEALKNGQVVAMTTDNTILGGLRSLDEDAFDLVPGTFTQEPYGIGIAKGREDLVRFIDDALRSAFADGAWTTAWDRTAGRILGAAPAPPDVESY